MASQSLISTVNGYENYIENKGKDEQVINAYVDACSVAINGEKDIEYGLQLTKRAKGLIEDFCTAKTGGTIWDLEKYAFDHKTTYELINKKYEVLLLEAQNKIVDSYFQYIEKKREPKDRFYMPRRKQLIKIGLVDALQGMIDDKYDILCVSLVPGAGKLLADDTPVLTTQGWKNHGDLKIGDYVYGIDGNPKKILHVFPKDTANCLLTFSNGEKIQCHENHEWVVWDRHRNKLRTIETKELFEKDIDSGEKNKRGHRYYYFLPHREPFKGKKREYAVEPYVLGVWLGDGTEKKPTLTICNTDLEIVNEVKKHYKLSTVYEQVGCKAYHFLGLRENLEKLGMCHSRKALGKRIPQEYLNGSLEQRLDLLAGLIDTDGTCNKKEKKYSISTTNEELKDGIINLISTFGWRCNISKAEPKISNSGIHGKKIVYRIGFSPTFEIPCRVERKQLKEFSKQRMVSITEVAHIEAKKGNCIQVEDGIYCVGKTMIPTHNSTIEKFFHSAVAGWFPKDYSLFYSHSGDITRMYYDGVYDIVTNDDDYAWHDIFPNLSVTSTNAKMEQFNIGKYKPFPSVQCTSVGSKNAGKVRASKFLLVDDMIGGIEEALNPTILDKLWDKYAVDARQRKTQDTDGKPCKEIHIATRWSVHDVIGRIQNMYVGNPRVKTISVPDVDPVTGESNFDYEYGGFTKEFFADQQLLMDEISYRCLYKQEPIEREGLLFPDDKIRRYFNLPHGEPEIITAQCDTKGKGTDYFVMPILQKYGEDYYCVDCVCDNTADYEMQYENASNTLVNNQAQECEFERNAGGDRVAMEVNKRVENKGWICNITDVPTETNKEARIFQCSNWILQHIIFKDQSLYKPNEPYGVMVSLLKRYSVTGKKQLDDVPDVFSNFALRMTQGSRIAKVEAVHNPFRGGLY